MTLLYVAIIVAAALVGVGVLRPQLYTSGLNKLFGFVVILVLAPLTGALGVNEHMERSKKVEYCLSCHTMEDYGKSLHIDDPRYLPAAHYLNGRLPRETACFACHTTYTMYGDLKAKMGGLRHVWNYYIGTIPSPLKIAQPYNNRECLHCHDGTRGFEETGEHNDEGNRQKIGKNELSCLSADCHPKTHAIGDLAKLKMWPAPGEEAKR